MAATGAAGCVLVDGTGAFATGGAPRWQPTANSSAQARTMPNGPGRDQPTGTAVRVISRGCRSSSPTFNSHPSPADVQQLLLQPKAADALPDDLHRPVKQMQVNEGDCNEILHKGVRKSVFQRTLARRAASGRDSNRSHSGTMAEEVWPENQTIALPAVDHQRLQGEVFRPERS